MTLKMSETAVTKEEKTKGEAYRKVEHINDIEVSGTESSTNSTNMIVPELKKGFSTHQWIYLFAIGGVHFGCAICVSLQAPFYPAEAEKKGATATEYGLVFGIFELVSFIASPLLGKYIHLIGPKTMLNTGLFMAAICSIAFGLLDLVKTHLDFIVLSFLIRIIEAVGASGATTAAFSLTAGMFPESLSATFAALEVFYGLGYIVGPLVGSLLYSHGGYPLPFVVMGTFLMLVAVFIYFVLPKHVDDGSTKGGSLLKMLSIPGVMLDTLCIVAAAISMGYVSATLEPHIRMFELSPVLIGVVFMTSGTMYAIAAPLIGRLCDVKVQTKKVIAFGCFLVLLSYFLLGPMPGLSLPKTLWMCILGLVVHGVGLASILPPCFGDILNSAKERGFREEFSTYGMVSGIWASGFALGAFVGPSIAGVLYDAVGFQIGTMFPIAVHVVMFLSTTIFILLEKRSSFSPVSLPEPEVSPGVYTLGRNLPLDIPPLSSKCSDNIRQSGYGSFGTPSSFYSLVH